MSDEQKYFPWNEGISTKPEVDRLLAHWRPETIKPGEWRVTDDEIKAVVGMCEGVRYKTVTDAWRKRLQNDHSVTVYREKTAGFFAPTPDEVFSRTHPTLQHAGRAIGKQMRHVATVKPQNELHRTTQDHQGRLLYVQRRELKKARMNLLPKTEAQAVPQIKPPTEKAG